MDRWSQLLKEVDKARRRIHTEPFFRGHSNDKWKLLPSLFRKPSYRDNENDLYYDFLSYSGPLYQSHRSPWDILFDMRHCGIPTRLLDWTKTFAVALYFALKGKVRQPSVWILDPYELNQRVAGFGVINPISDLDYDYFSAYISQRDNPPNGPLAMIPPMQNKRQFAQKGVFTLHGRLGEPLEQQFPDYVQQIQIPKSVIPKAKKFLELSGIDEYALFPDFDGLGRHLVEMYS